MYKTVNVKDFGAKGNGWTDDADAFQAALDAGANEVIVPIGNYKIGHTLTISSNTTLTAHPCAVIRLANHTSKKRGDFLLTNRNHNDNDHRDTNIVIRGGTWDGNNKTNAKPKVLRDETACSGAIMSFKNINGLTLSTLTLKDSGGYNARFCRINGFLIENITFCAFNPMPNNDGIHINGFVENGIIRNLVATTPGAPSDDMVALNADEICDRCEALDMECGYIRNVVIDGLRAVKCQSFVRILSVYSDITNISVSNVSGGFWGMAVNMDGARYCMTPIVEADTEESRKGFGEVRNVHLSHFRVHSLNEGNNAYYIRLESNMHDFTIDDFVRETELEANHKTTTMRLNNVSPSNVKFHGATDKKCLTKFAKGHEDEITERQDVLENDVCDIEFNTEYYDNRIYAKGSFAHLEINQL